MVLNKLGKMMFIPRSLVFYPGYFKDNCNELSDQVILPSHFINHFIDRFYTADDTLYLAYLINTNTGDSVVVSIGTPHFEDRDILFAPQWVLDAIKCSGNCDTPIKIEKVSKTEFPLATRIVIKPLDPLAFETNIVECFQNALMNMCVLQQGLTLPIIIPEFGNYEFLAYIEKVEPEMNSLSHSDELSVEFINEFANETATATATATPIVRPPTPIPIQSNTILFPQQSDSKSESESESQTHSLTPEQRRQQVRQAWANRCLPPNRNTNDS
jgi:hypothetical protein